MGAQLLSEGSEEARAVRCDGTEARRVHTLRPEQEVCSFQWKQCAWCSAFQRRSLQSSIFHDLEVVEGKGSGGEDAHRARICGPFREVHGQGEEVLRRARQQEGQAREMMPFGFGKVT